MNPFKSLAISGLITALSGCNFSDTRQDDDPGSPSPRSGDGSATPGSGTGVDAYQKLQADLFNTTCAKCHNPGRSAAGVDLTTYAVVKQNAAQALAEIEAGAMPPSGQVIDGVLLAGLKCWVGQGAPESGAAECFPGQASGTETGTSSSTGTDTGTAQDTGTCVDDSGHDDDDPCLSHRRRGGEADDQ